MERNNFVLLFLFLVQLSYGQFQRADKFFLKRDYEKAAELYEIIWEKERSKEALQKLAECYYYVSKYTKANQTLSKLTAGDFKDEDKYYDNKYNFMYYHFLSATGDYEKAIDYLIRYKKNRGLKPLGKQSALEEMETFRLKKSDYTIKIAKFKKVLNEYSGQKKGSKSFKLADLNFENHELLDNCAFVDVSSIIKSKKETVKTKKGNPKEQSSKINREGSFSFSKNGKSLYFSSFGSVEVPDSFYGSTYKKQIFVAKKVNGTWSKPIKLPFNTEEYNYEHPVLSPDEKRLYFSSNDLGSIGSYDIYYVDINDDGSYGNMKNLSYIINTESRELFPYVSEDGHLFFASDGHLGLGMLDVFVSKCVDGKFTKPMNLGAPINSRYDDFSLRYFDAKNGYFISNRDKAIDFILEFEQTGEIFEREYINTFEVRDVDNENYIGNAHVDLRLNGVSIYQNTLDSEAQFNINLPPGVYELKTTAVGYGDRIMRIDIKENNNQKHVVLLAKNNEIANIIKNESAESQAVINQLLQDKDPPKLFVRDGKLYFDVPPIYFDFSGWEIRADSKEILTNLAKKLKKYPSLSVRITSHTDNRGTFRYNQVLSEKRAESTRNFMIKQGKVKRTRVSFKGYGKSKPLVKCTDCSEEQYQQNRRSEFEIVRY